MPGDDRPDDISGAVPLIEKGQSLVGNIERSDDRDLFSFRAERGREYRIETHLRSNDDTVLVLYGPDGNYLVEDDDSGDGAASLLVWTALSSDTYYIEVSGYGGATGTYALSLHETSRPAASVTTSLEEYEEYAAEFVGGPGAI